MPQVQLGELAGFARAYLKRLFEIGGDSAMRVVNKTPLNFRYLGLIALVLPGARVIHCRRNPLDTCLSCYFQKFTTGHGYSFNLFNLGGFYRHYRAVMVHWESVRPLPVLEVDYEALVSDLPGQARRLVEFTGLEWGEACALPRKAGGTIKTASAYQVRQPVHARSVERWRNYEHHLGDLIGALGEYAT